MRYSGIGGQAVMEGVMMKNKERYAVAVRKPDQEIEVMTKEYKGIVPGEVWQKIPLVRGVLSFIDSLVLGMSTLMYSASFFEDEEESKEKKQDTAEKKKAKENAMMGGTVALSIILAVKQNGMQKYWKLYGNMMWIRRRNSVSGLMKQDTR